MRVRTLGALLLSLGLVACGGGGKAAPAEPAPEEPAREEPAREEPAREEPAPEPPTEEDDVCCCFFGTPSGDFHDDYSLSSPGECEASGGTCVDGDTPGCPS